MKQLYPHQKRALVEMTNGSVLVGGTGSGKSLVALYYYYTKVLGGSFDPPISPPNVVDLYVITTARKRDELDWEKEAIPFGLSTKEKPEQPVKFTVDSWNNIKKYREVSRSFFIFDEQRSTGKGVWSKSFVKIAKKNGWIMLSATPADNWMDLTALFIANGYYKNITEFNRRHVVFAPYVKYPKVQRYLEEDHLKRLRSQIYVIMSLKRHTTQNDITISVDYDKDMVRKIVKEEWDPYRNEPISNLPRHNFVVRRCINSHPSRAKAVLDLFQKHNRLIVFYNFNFELELLRNVLPLKSVFEYNGHKHDPVPDKECWVYLVQYTSGSEAWECFTTNHMVFYSLNYSYRKTIQSRGRINRLTTPYEDLYYYTLVSDSYMDRQILKALQNKKNFNERGIKFK